MGLKAVAQSQSQSQQTDASNNTTYGTPSLNPTTTGTANTAYGYYALNSDSSGGSNTANGAYALAGLTTGSSNTAIGMLAGEYLANGSTANVSSDSSVFIGYNSKAGLQGQTNEIVIGASATGAGVNSVTLGNTYITKTVLQGSVGIGTTNPNAYAILDVTSTSKAFVLPRMTTAQKLAGIVTPVSGMLVYDTTLNKLSVYGGASWETVTSV